MSQFSVPCVVYRGGTSRGLFFHKKDLPVDTQARNRIFLEGIDCYNPSQVNGLGGTTSSTSKVCVISPSEREGVHVDWTFYQLGVAETVVDDKGTCGNLMAGVGAFAVDEGLVPVDPAADLADVFVYNTNIKKVLHMEVPVIQGKAKVSGDYHMPGVVKPGAMFRVSIVKPGGEMTGKLLLKGPKTDIATATAVYEVTFADLINPFIFLPGQAVGLVGNESQRTVADNQTVLNELNLIRDKVAVVTGMAASEEEARYKKPNVPKIAVVSPAQKVDVHGGANTWSTPGSQHQGSLEEKFVRVGCLAHPVDKPLNSVMLQEFAKRSGRFPRLVLLMMNGCGDVLDFSYRIASM